MSHHSASYSLTIRLSYSDSPGFLGKITSVIGASDGFIGAVDIVEVKDGKIVRDFTVSCTDVEHGERIVDVVEGVEGVTIVNVSDRTFLVHLGGKIEIQSKIPVKTRDDLSMAYTPGVARVCNAIAKDKDASFNLTIRKNTVAVVSDGSAVLGLGNIGPEAAMPVMEGKALLFKEFAGIDSFPICLDTQDTEEIINIVAKIAPTFGGINLEDISSPRCIEIEERLSEMLDIPVFHDDQHGTAIVVLAGLTNSLKVIGKELSEIQIVINGAGAAGIAIANLLMTAGAKDVVVCDSKGAIYEGRTENMNSSKEQLALKTNPNKKSGDIHTVIAGSDVFIGVSVAGAINNDDVKSMNTDPIVFALANPNPEISPEDAAPHAKVMATGRSDYPNQINNVLCFPGLFKGAMSVRAKQITTSMKLAAAQSIANVIRAEDVNVDYVIPSVFDRRVAKEVSKAVADAAVKEGVNRRTRKKI